MSEIKAGDLVVQIKPLPCCGYVPSTFGVPFVVAEIGIDDLFCHECHSMIALKYADSQDGTAYNIDTLKKIPPLNELEDQTEERKVEV